MKRNTTKKYYLFSIISLLLCFTSCNDWLNVNPQGQVEAEDLYATTKGCNAALGGVYYTFSGSNLYGRNLTYGIVDILAQYWDFSTNTSHQFYNVSTYDYKSSVAVNTFGNIWGDLYYVIAQCNAFIEYSSPHSGKISNYDLLLGEAHGLRALAHLLLFELYGPVIHTTADLQKPAIAYRTEYSNISREFDSGEVVLQKAAEDLSRAAELLANDPIRENGRRGDLNTSIIDYEDVLNYRGARMNYFCTLGLLARLEMLRKNPDAAYIYAERILTESENIISLVDKENIMGSSASRVNNYSTEMLGSFYVNDLYDMTYALFDMEGKGTSANSSLVLSVNQLNIWLNGTYNRAPDGTGADNRFIYWFVKDEETGAYNFTKYHEAEERVNMEAAYNPEVSIMRISEVYYIACESQIGKDNELALQYLNKVRVTRNLPELEGPLDDETLLEYLVREARKDFIGEGRMFAMYKRLFKDIYVRQGVVVEASDARFVIPIPDDEYEFTGIENPAGNQ